MISATNRARLMRSVVLKKFLARSLNHGSKFMETRKPWNGHVGFYKPTPRGIQFTLVFLPTKFVIKNEELAKSKTFVYWSTNRCIMSDRNANAFDLGKS
jgi:hypothetical protein